MDVLVEEISKYFHRSDLHPVPENSESYTAEVPHDLDRNTITDLIDYFDNKLLPQLSELDGAFKIQQLEVFYAELTEAAQSSGHNELMSLADKLNKAIGTLDIVAIKSLLSKLEIIARDLKQNALEA